MELKLENLTYSIKGITILEKTNLIIKTDSLTILFGPNGSGKTILLKIMSGIIKDYKGEIYINDKNIKSYSTKELSNLVGYVPPNSYSVFSYSVLDYILMGKVAGENMFYYPTKKDKEKANDILNLLDISDLKNKNYNNLSTGEKQLVLIARSLMKNLSIIFLDEPVSNLDFFNQHKLFRVIMSLKSKGIFVIVSIHDPTLALKYAEKIILMKKAKIYKVISLRDSNSISIFSDYLNKTYSSEVKIVQNNNRFFVDM